MVTRQGSRRGCSCPVARRYPRTRLKNEKNNKLRKDKRQPRFEPCNSRIQVSWKAGSETKTENTLLQSDQTDCWLPGCDVIYFCRWSPTFRNSDQHLQDTRGCRKPTNREHESISPSDWGCRLKHRGLRLYLDQSESRINVLRRHSWKQLFSLWKVTLSWHAPSGRQPKNVAVQPAHIKREWICLHFSTLHSVPRMAKGLSLISPLSSHSSQTSWFTHATVAFPRTCNQFCSVRSCLKWALTQMDVTRRKHTFTCYELPSLICIWDESISIETKSPLLVYGSQTPLTSNDPRLRRHFMELLQRAQSSTRQ